MVLSLAVETYQSKQSVKIPSRVVVKNERGERVLDTLIKPPAEENAINLGKKTQHMYNLA
jgi:hypothetical protein